jgi:hypothetical protein
MSETELSFEPFVISMRAQSIDFAPGLTDAEIEAAEAAHHFHFPPDLRAFLQVALPVGQLPTGGHSKFPDWQNPTDNYILSELDWPAHGVCFDVESKRFWLPEWGPRPPDLEMAKVKAREAVQAAPFFIPILGHRYMPAVPCEPGNPVFSVWQIDIIHWGIRSAFVSRKGIQDPESVSST